MVERNDMAELIEYPNKIAEDVAQQADEQEADNDNNNLPQNNNNNNDIPHISNQRTDNETPQLIEKRDTVDQIQEQEQEEEEEEEEVKAAKSREQGIDNAADVIKADEEVEAEGAGPDENKRIETFFSTLPIRFVELFPQEGWG